MVTVSSTLVRALRHAGTVTLLALLATTVAAVAQDAPPPDGGLFVVEGEADSDADLNSLLTSEDADQQSLGDGPQIEIDATGVGWAYSPYPLYVLTGSTRPWRMRLNAEPMLMVDNPENEVELTEVEARDALAPTPWTSVDGTPLWQNLSGNPEQYLALEFRVNVGHHHAPGHYVSHMVIEWFMPAVEEEGLPASSGTIPMELHLDVPELINVSLDGDTLNIPTIARDEGWAYSDSEVTMTVGCIQDFDLHIDSAPDLTLGDAEIPTALRLRQISGDGPEWDYWGDLGGTAHGQSSDPWTAAESTGSPWPGNVGAGGGAGETTIGISAAAWRNSYEDAPGDYATSVVITVSLP